MSVFEPKKRHLREVLLYFFNMKKSAVESNRLLVEPYDEAALSEITCCGWFRRFKSGDFYMEDKMLGRPKLVEDAELDAFGENLYQTQEEFAESLKVILSTIFTCLEALGMIQKQGNWLLYKLDTRDMERPFFHI